MAQLFTFWGQTVGPRTSGPRGATVWGPTIRGPTVQAQFALNGTLQQTFSPQARVVPGKSGLKVKVREDDGLLGPTQC